MTVWLLGLIGTALAQQSSSPHAAACAELGFTPGDAPTFPSFQASEDARRFQELNGFDDPLQAYRSCLWANTTLTPMSCEVVFGRDCADPLERDTVAGLNRALEEEDSTVTFGPIWQENTAVAGPPEVSTEEGDVPWTWAPGADTRDPPGPEAPASTEPQRPASSAWSREAAQGPGSTRDPHGWWRDPAVQEAYGKVQASEGRQRDRAEAALDDLLAPYGKDLEDLVARETAWRCTEASLERERGATGELDPGLPTRLAGQTRQAWAAAAEANEAAGEEGPQDASRCLGHKLLILRSYNERAAELYDRAMDAIDHCDGPGLVEAQRQLQTAADRAGQVGREAQACLEPEVTGESTTVVTVVESGLEGDDDLGGTLQDPLDPVGEDLNANPAPVAPDPVSPFE